MSKSAHNSHRFSIALAALLFLVCSVMTRSCGAGELLQASHVTHICCTDEARESLALPEVACCGDVATAIPERKQLDNCACISQSRPGTLWQTPFYSIDFISSFSAISFLHHSANVGYCKERIKRSNYLQQTSSSRAPPHLISL